MQPTCAAIHDLSCYAKSSLTVVLPVLEVMGVETCPLPTALLSSQTDGFSSYYFRDMSADIKGILDAWKNLDLRFDAIYSGFLGSADQVALIKQLSGPAGCPDPCRPRSGDGGSLYGPVTDQQVTAMQQLVCCADVITPNTTEAALLLGRPYQEQFETETALTWARELALATGSKVAITSVPCLDANVVACYADGASYVVPYQRFNASYPGCGDLFASLLLGFLLGKETFQSAVELAVSFTSKAIERTIQAGYETRHGISVSPVLVELAKR